MIMAMNERAEEEIRKEVRRHQNLKDYEDDIVEFFNLSFACAAASPEQSRFYFVFKSEYISLLIGNIYACWIHFSKEDYGIIVDQEFIKEGFHIKYPHNNVNIKTGDAIYWFSTRKLSNLFSVFHDPDILSSHLQAMERIRLISPCATDRARNIEGRIPLPQLLRQF